MLGFASIIGLPTRSAWLTPISLLLLPVALVLAIIGIIVYPINFIAATSLWRRDGVYGVATEEGLGVGKRHGSLRILPWQELSEVVAVFAPPFWYYEVLLHSGERVEVDFLHGKDGARPALEAHGVPIRKEKGVRTRRRTSE